MTARAFALATAPLILATPSVVTGLLPDSAALVVIAWALLVVALTTRKQDQP